MNDPSKLVLSSQIVLVIISNIQNQKVNQVETKETLIENLITISLCTHMKTTSICRGLIKTMTKKLLSAK